MTDYFVKLPLALMAASHWISKITGEQISLSSSEKILWAYMVKRFTDFNKLGNLWFDNQHAMAAATGTSLSTANRFVAKLAEHGYLIITTRQLSGCAVSNSYVIASDLELYNKNTVVAVVTAENVPEVGTMSEAPVVTQEAANNEIATHAAVAFKLYLVEPTEAPAKVTEVAPWSPPVLSGHDEPQWDTVVSSGTSV